jgi:hypothetical protein
MSAAALSSGTGLLVQAARALFTNLYEIGNVIADSELHRDLRWTPAFRFTINDYIHVFVEPSESTPYPRIFSLRHADVMQFPEPIAVYVACPEEVFHDPANQADVQKLEEHGYGLIAVDGAGVARRKFTAVPLVQVISQAEYKTLIDTFPPKIRQRVAQAYEDYKGKPSVGVVTLTETVEGLAKQAAKDAAAKGWITKGQAEGNIASALDAMYAVPQLQNARAAIGGVRAYIAKYRNLSHHWPKNRKKAHQKYTECRHAFLDGLRQMTDFREAMKNSHLSGNLPRA